MPGVPPGRLGYLGPRGTFCEAALRTLPVASAQRLEPYVSVADALDAVRRGDVVAAPLALQDGVRLAHADELEARDRAEPDADRAEARADERDGVGGLPVEEHARSV